jgi:hypothetical protein
VVNRTTTYPPLTGGYGGCHWYFDFTGTVGAKTTNTLYVACDPTTHAAELTVVQRAFNTGNANVTLENLSIEKYATPLQRGAVELDGSGDLVNANWVTHNHGEGIKPSDSQQVTVSYNEIVENGESGVNSGGDSNVNNVYMWNVIERNNEDGVSYGTEAGGTKFVVETGMSLHDNTVRYNNGQGIWCDGCKGGNAIDHQHHDRQFPLGDRLRDQRRRECAVHDYPEYCHRRRHVPPPGLCRCPRADPL